jgi:hypothetical protein
MRSFINKIIFLKIMVTYKQVAPAIKGVLRDYGFSNVPAFLKTERLLYDPSGSVMLDGFRLDTMTKDQTGKIDITSDLNLVRYVKDEIEVLMIDLGGDMGVDIDLRLRYVSGRAPRVFNYANELHPFIMGTCDDGDIVIDPSLQEVLLFGGSRYEVNSNGCDFNLLEKNYLMLRDKCDVAIQIANQYLIRLVTLVDSHGITLMLSHIDDKGNAIVDYSVARKPFRHSPDEPRPHSSNLEKKVFELVRDAIKPDVQIDEPRPKGKVTTDRI